MGITEFANRVIEKIYDFGDKEVKANHHQIIKANDRVLNSINIVSSGSIVSRNFYIDEFYDEYLNGLSFEDVSDQILELVRNDSNDIDIESISTVRDLCDYEAISSRIIPKVLNKERNELYLQDKVFVDYLDLAVCFCLYIEGISDGMATAVVTKSMAKTWDVTNDELMKRAIENMESILSPRVDSMMSVLREITTDVDGLDISIPDDNFGMYVVTNSIKTFGSSYILSKDLFRNLAVKLGNCNLIIIPSSLHELLVVPERKDTIEDDINQMIVEVNRSQVLIEDYLSNHLYKYDFAADEIVM